MAVMLEPVLTRVHYTIYPFFLFISLPTLFLSLSISKTFLRQTKILRTRYSCFQQWRFLLLPNGSSMLLFCCCCFWFYSLVKNPSPLHRSLSLGISIFRFSLLCCFFLFLCFGFWSWITLFLCVLFFVLSYIVWFSES